MKLTLSKEENFFRLYFLCQKIVTQADRLFFDSKVPRLEFFTFFLDNIIHCTLLFDSPVNKTP
jgi:hypothetical protein